MANVNGVNYTDFLAGTSDSTWIGRGKVKTNVKVWSDQYTAAALAAGQTIGIGSLPDGAIIHQVIITHDAFAGATLDIGDADTATRYGSAIDVATAGVAFADEPGGLSQYIIGTDASTNEIILTVGGAAITGDITTAIIYSN